MMDIETVATLIGKGLWELGICNEPARVFYPIAEKIMAGCRGNMAAAAHQAEHTINAKGLIQIGEVQLNQKQSQQALEHLAAVQETRKHLA